MYDVKQLSNQTNLLNKYTQTNVYVHTKDALTIKIYGNRDYTEK